MAGRETTTERLDDMLARYGEICTQKEAARILSVQPRSIHRMMEQGRLRRVGHRVDVRSIVELIENCGLPRQRNNTGNQRGTISEGSFFAAARGNRWVPNQG